VLAVLGQARSDERISPEREGRLVGDLLEHWALVSTFPEQDQPPAVRPQPSPAPAPTRARTAPAPRGYGPRRRCPAVPSVVSLIGARGTGPT
jgi:hypothetical protein